MEELKHECGIAMVRLRNVGLFAAAICVTVILVKVIKMRR